VLVQSEQQKDDTSCGLFALRNLIYFLNGGAAPAGAAPEMMRYTYAVRLWETAPSTYTKHKTGLLMKNYYCRYGEIIISSLLACGETTAPLRRQASSLDFKHILTRHEPLPLPQVIHVAVEKELAGGLSASPKDLSAMPVASLSPSHGNPGRPLDSYSQHAGESNGSPVVDTNMPDSIGIESAMAEPDLSWQKLIDSQGDSDLDVASTEDLLRNEVPELSQSGLNPARSADTPQRNIDGAKEPKPRNWANVFEVPDSQANSEDEEYMLTDAGVLIYRILLL
jgi:hypothetical protein